MATSHLNVRNRSWRQVALSGVAALGLAVAVGGCTSESPTQAGDRLSKEGDYQAAVGAYQTVVKEDPRDYETFYKLGNNYSAAGEKLEAIEAYKTGLDVMGTTLMGQEDAEFREKLLDALAKAVASAPTADAEMDSLEQQGRTKKAPEAYYLLAKIARHRGDPDTALDDYNRAVVLDGKNFYVLREFGLYLAELKQTPKATQTLRDAYRLNSTDPQVNAGLREVGIVPGPSLLNPDQLAEPVIPRGPIPRVDFGKVRAALHLGPAAPARAVTPPVAPPAPVTGN